MTKAQCIYMVHQDTNIKYILVQYGACNNKVVGSIPIECIN